MKRLKPLFVAWLTRPALSKSSSRTVYKTQVFPQRSNADSALIEWGHSAVIHAADAVVAEFGIQATEQEFELGLEAAPVVARPSQGCEPLRNGDESMSQMVFMFRGACDFKTKAKHAMDAGAVALVIINHDQTRPDHAFSMVKPKAAVATDGAVEEPWNPQIPCVMVSWNSGQAILEDRPERLRLYPGGGRPFIESVSDDSPVVFLIHNLLEPEEIAFLKEAAAPRLHPSTAEDDDVRVRGKVVERSFETTTLHRGMWRSSIHKLMDEKLFSIINFPQEYFADIQVNRFVEGSFHGPHYDSDQQPSLYRERVMTVVYCLDTVLESDGGAMTFPKAPLEVRPQAGLAIVYHNTGEDGGLDPASLHAVHKVLNGTMWTATQRILSAPLPLASRTLIPALVVLAGGRPPNLMVSYQKWLIEQLGADRGFVVFNHTFMALALGLLLTIVGLPFVWFSRQNQAGNKPPHRRTSGRKQKGN